MLETEEEQLRDGEAADVEGAPTQLDSREFGVGERSQWRLAGRRFLRHRAATISMVVFVLLVLFAFVLPHFWTYSYTQITDDLNQSPSGKHPFGTDTTGFDMLAVVMRGTEQSLKVAFIIALLATGVGAIWGVIAGYIGRLVDSALMRLADLILTIPALALAAALAHRGGGTVTDIGLVLGFVYAPYVARVVRGAVLSLREQDFVEASRALGATRWRIMFRHLIPNTSPVLIVNVTLLVAQGILLETALSFVGFGVQAPDTSLGLLVSKYVTAIQFQPWLFYFPGVFIILIALSVNFIGDGLRDALDPRQTRERR